MSTRKVNFVLPDGEKFHFDETVAGTITVTYGESVENHARMEKIGEQFEHGISTKDLKKAMKKLKKKYPRAKIEYVDLTKFAPKDVDVADAGVLIIRDGVRLFGRDPDKMMRENVEGYEWDKKALMRGQVKNKTARWNVCYADYDQDPQIESGKGRVVDFKHLPETSAMREVWPTFLPDITKKLNAEGNYYYNPNECGIGWHGDGERVIVIAIRLGVSIPLMYNWYQRSKQIGERCELELNHGDIYVMSEKATGNDWLKKVIPTLRHTAGAPRFTKYVEKDDNCRE